MSVKTSLTTQEIALSLSLKVQRAQIIPHNLQVKSSCDGQTGYPSFKAAGDDSTSRIGNGCRQPAAAQLVGTVQFTRAHMWSLPGCWTSSIMCSCSRIGQNMILPAVLLIFPIPLWCICRAEIPESFFSSSGGKVKSDGTKTEARLPASKELGPLALLLF